MKSKLNLLFAPLFISGLITGQVLTASAQDPTSQTNNTRTQTMLENKYQKPSDDVLREKLSPLQYQVTQHEGTEKPFSNEYWDEKRDGIYVDIVSGEPLFSSTHKYESDRKSVV